MLQTQATFYVLVIIGNIVAASTSECGPRDVVAARRTCNRACLPDGTCRKKNKECVCDGLCGLSCLRKRCPMLTELLNGNMIVNPVDRTIGAEVSYSCKDGYVIFGQTNRICQANKTWSGTEPMCTLSDSTTEGPRQECAERDEVAAGRSCGKACQPDGTCKKENRECVCDGLCGLTCLKKIPCPLLELSDGILEYRDGNNRIIEQPHHGDIRTATCSDGHVLIGISQSICSSGVWQDALPGCQRLPCPILDLEDGALAYLDQNNQRVFEPHHGDIRVAVCKDGRSLRGKSQTQCISGSWQGVLPSCEAVSCDHQPLDNGIITYTLDGVGHQEPVHGVMRSFSCDAGYTLDDEDPSQCDSGSWTRSLPVCNESPCNINDLLSEDWDIVYNHPKRRDELAEVMKPPGTVATFTCKTIGYVTAGINTRTCRQGEWDGQNPSCVKRTCRSIQLNNGRFEYRDNDNIVILNPKHGDFRGTTCNRGYYLQGPEETQCWDGEWEDELPTCREEPCNMNDLPAGDWDIEFNYPGGRNEASEVMKSPGTVARFSCNVFGYTIDGDDTRLCTLGRWNGPRMSCERSRCQIIQLEDGRLRYYDSDDTRTLTPRHGDYRVATCNEGYSLAGTPSTQCFGGEWIDELPTCQENPCSLLTETEVPDYLQVTYISRGRGGRTISSSEGSVPSRGLATFTCREEGFVLSGDSYRTCKRGTWRGEFPECVMAHCSVETIDNGGVTRANGDPFTQEASHGDSVRFTCEQGYTLVGDEISHCDAGEWNPGLPTCVEGQLCQIRQCVVPYIDNGHYSANRGGTPLVYGTCLDDRRFLFVLCDEGMRLDGSGYYVCNRGKFVTRNNDNTLSSCSRVTRFKEQEQTCASPAVGSLVEVFVGRHYTPLDEHETFREGDFITSRCQDPRRQKFEGSVVRRCEEGQWSGHPAQCVPTIFVFNVGNTIMQNVTENGTIIVFPIRGFVTISCRLQNGARGVVDMFYEGRSSFQPSRGYNQKRHHIQNPSPLNSGKYRCESNGQSHSINTSFKAITCPPPEHPHNWNHDRVPANRDGRLGYVFTESVSLICPYGYISSNPVPAYCTHHGTWTNMPQTCIHGSRP